MADRRPPRSFPRWPRYSVTAALIASIEKAMGDQGVTRTDLARQLSVTQGAITRLLGGHQASSAMVPEVCKILGLPPPDEALPDEVVELSRQLDDHDREMAVAFLRRLVRKND